MEKKFRVALLFIEVQLLSGAICQDLCKWKDPQSGNSYDLSILKRPKENPWKVFDAQTSGMFDIEYQFNFCDTLPKKCNGIEASAIEFLDIYESETDTCEVLGHSTSESNMMYRLIDDRNASKGIMVSFIGGAPCQGSDTPSLNGQPRKVLFRLECAAEQEDQFILNEVGGTQGTTKCELHFLLKTPAACPFILNPPAIHKQASSSLSLIGMVLIMFIIYLTLGTLYNISHRNISGLEAIPYIHIWKEIPSFTKIFLLLFLEKSMLIAAIARGYIKSKIELYKTF